MTGPTAPPDLVSAGHNLSLHLLAKRRARDQLRCSATKPTGRPCRAFANPDAGLCVSHGMTPEQRTQRGIVGAAGHMRVTDELRPDFRSAKRVRRTLEKAADLVARGKLSVSAAKAVAQLAQQALKAIEHANEEKLLDLEDEQRGQR